MGGGRPCFEFMDTGHGCGAWAGALALWSPEDGSPASAFAHSAARAQPPCRPSVWLLGRACQGAVVCSFGARTGVRSGRRATRASCASVFLQEVLQNLYRTKSFLFVGCGETLRDQIFQALFLYSVPNKVDLEHYMLVLKESEDLFFKQQADMLLHGIKVVSYGDRFACFPGYVQELAAQICRQRSPGAASLLLPPPGAQMGSVPAPPPDRTGTSSRASLPGAPQSVMCGSWCDSEVWQRARQWHAVRVACALTPVSDTPVA